MPANSIRNRDRFMDDSDLGEVPDEAKVEEDDEAEDHHPVVGNVDDGVKIRFDMHKPESSFKHQQDFEGHDLLEEDSSSESSSDMVKMSQAEVSDDEESEIREDEAMDRI